MQLTHTIRPLRPAALAGMRVSAICLAAVMASAGIAQTPTPAADTTPTAVVATPTAIASTVTQAAPVASDEKPAAPAKPAASAPAKKDVVLDNPTAAPNSSAASAATGGQQVSDQGGRTSQTQDSAIAAALGDLGVALLRGQSTATGKGQANGVSSAVSLASALGLAHAGAAGSTANEMAGLLGPASAAARVYARDYPALLKKLAQPSSPLTMANRVWVDQRIAPALSVTYANTVRQRFASEGALLDFAQPEPARKSINDWAAKQTAGLIKDLLPAGAVSPATQMVLTNAVHFKSPWQQAFDPALTAPKPFFADPKAPVNVPTMSQTMQVRSGVVDGATVLELPFAKSVYTLLVAMPPEGQTLNAFENELSGGDMAKWQAQIKPISCAVGLPKFAIEPQSVSLKATLQGLGVKTLFGEQADFSPMLGAKGKGVVVDNVYQSAGITIDESGGEAVAATAVVMISKSLAGPAAPSCQVNRPFIFAVVHKATGTPVFVGKIANPGAAR
jgi:serpin B